MGIRGINEANILEGVSGIPTLASATTVQIRERHQRITGNTTISTINQPPETPYFQGPLFLFNTDSSVGGWDTNGNIAIAGTFTRYHLFIFYFDSSVGKWYPSAVA